MNSGDLSIGIGLRRAHFSEFERNQRAIDWVEIIAENYVGLSGVPCRMLDVVKERCPIAVHGVSSSLGGVDALDEAWCRQLRQLLDHVGTNTFSEHACWSSHQGWHSHDLLPMPFTDKSAAHLAGRAREFKSVVGCDLILENISYYAEMPTSDQTESTFLTHTLESSDTGLLLDIANIVVNASNHGKAPLEWLKSLPMARTRQIHIAGHRKDYGVLLDDHGSAPPVAVLDLLVEALRMTGPVPILLEWDHNIPPLGEVLDEVERVRRYITTHLNTDLHEHAPVY